MLIPDSRVELEESGFGVEAPEDVGVWFGEGAGEERLHFCEDAECAPAEFAGGRELVLEFRSKRALRVPKSKR